MSNPAYQAARAKKSRIAIIEAALALFVVQGFSTVKLKDIAAAANVSTATLFKHFPQKENLLSAAIETLSAMEDDTPASQASFLTEEGLHKIGLSYAKRLDHPMMLGLIRLGVTESSHMPDLGQAVLDAWRGPFNTRMENLLDHAARQGHIIITDRSVAVRQFFGLMTDALLWPRLLLQSAPAHAGYREAVVNEAVKTFMARYK